MKTSRLEAFSDGVLAIVITIMVLEFKVPEESNFHSLISMIPIFISYLLSFVYIGIAWSNHHHLFQIAEKVNGTILWANLHLLFWISLIPFATSWIGENHLETAPVALYGLVLIMTATAYFILQKAIINHHDKDFSLDKAIGKGAKGIFSTIIYAFGIAMAFFIPTVSIVCYIIVALIWIVPDKRIESLLKQRG